MAVSVTSNSFINGEIVSQADNEVVAVLLKTNQSF
jgi:hypothetical protein